GMALGGTATNANLAQAVVPLGMSPWATTNALAHIADRLAEPRHGTARRRPQRLRPTQRNRRRVLERLQRRQPLARLLQPHPELERPHQHGRLTQLTQPTNTKPGGAYPTPPGQSVDAPLTLAGEAGQLLMLLAEQAFTASGGKL